MQMQMKSLILSGHTGFLLYTIILNYPTKDVRCVLGNSGMI